MTELEQYRLEIDQIDQELTRLVEQRFNLAKKVANYKINHKLPVLDASREKIVIQKNQERLTFPGYQTEITAFYTHLMAISRSIQENRIDT